MFFRDYTYVKHIDLSEHDWSVNFWDDLTGFSLQQTQ